MSDAPESTLTSIADGEVAVDLHPRNDSDGVPASVKNFLRSHESVPRVSVLARIFGRAPVTRALLAEYKMAKGDVAVIDVFSQLGSDWLVRTSEAANGSGVEHVAIGPSGIYCMSIQHYSGGAVWIDGGVLLVDGEPRPHLRDTEFCAVRLTQVISDAVGHRVEAAPCLVLVDPRSVTVAKPPRRVAVMTLRDIRTWLKGMPTQLSPDELTAVRDSAVGCSMLHDLGGSGPAPKSALDKFRKVRADMDQARHVRLTWVTGALVLVWFIAVVGIGGVTTGFLAL